MADFFQEPEKAPEVTEPSKVKVGESEYSQDELSKLVGLGKIAEEAETKYGRSVEKFWPEYTKSQQELKELRGKVEEFDSFQKRVSGQTEPSQENLREQALNQARDLGLATADQVDKLVEEKVLATIQAQNLLGEIETINKQAEETGKPKADVQKLLEYMDETGFKSPSKAYKDMFEKELDEWNAKKVNEIKPTGYSTQDSSTAGAKAPNEERPGNKEQLQQSLRNYFKAAEGSEK